MKKTLKELLELRASKITQITTLTEERGESMDETTLATIKSIKEEIEGVDNKIEAIEATRSLAIKNSKPMADKEKDAATEFRSTFDKYLRGQINNETLEKRIMQAGQAGKGLETVPDEFYRTLLDKIKEYGMLFSDANVMTTANHGDMLIPLADDTANAGAWTAEGGTIVATDFATSRITMKAYKVTTAIVISTELLEDAFFDVQTYVAGALGIRLARTFESAFINGDGTGKPLGIVADPATIDVTSTTTAIVDHKDMLNAIYALTPTLRMGGVFYVSDAQRKAMDSWEDGNNRPLLQLSQNATQANGMETTLYGYPVRINFELGDPAVAGDVPVIFGNPQNYWIRNIRNITVKRSDELYAMTDEVLFTATTRLDGKIVNANPAFSKVTVAP